MNSQPERFDQERLEHPVFPAYPAVASRSLAEKQVHHGTGNGSTKGGRSRVTIDILPDVALLSIFDFYGYQQQWYTLVHVCRKWRSLVFGSPRRLNLRLYCGARTPVKKTLDVWPLLPIVIDVSTLERRGVGNIVAALEHNDRIAELDLFILASLQLEKVLAAMQQPFPALTHLDLGAGDETTSVVPASFLGGSAPRLRSLTLHSIPFPGLPNLLLSATHLVHLYLWETLHSGYFSPEAMVTGLSVLNRLEVLVIEFESPQSRPDRQSQRPPLQTRALLPVLTKLWFKGVSEYLEDLIAQIDAPLVNDLMINVYHQLIFDTPQLSQFLSRTPRFKIHNEARVELSNRHVLVALPQTFDGRLMLMISCRQLEWKLSSLAQVCSSSFPQALILMVEHLFLETGTWRHDWQDDFENSQWLEFLHPFAAVKSLYISRRLAQRIAPALQDLVGDRATEVLPALKTLFFEKPLPSGRVKKAIGKFVAARQLASRPIAVSRWERKESN